jgi:GntR family transcriptional regulator
MRQFTAADRACLDPGLPIPLYHQLYGLVKRKIEGGELRHGLLLPAEKELGAFFGVSRITIQRALDELEAEGYVARQRGRGTRVTYQHPPKILRAPLDRMLESLEIMGRDTQVRLLQFTRVVAPPRVADALQLAPEQLVDCAVRVRSTAGTPFAHYTSWTVPLGRQLTAEALQSAPSRLELFRRLGVAIQEIDQVISAVAADATLAQRLHVRTGEPLLQVIRIAFDLRGKPIDYLLAAYRPDRFQYHMKLSAQDLLGREAR